MCNGALRLGAFFFGIFWAGQLAATVIGRVQLLTTSLWLVISLVAGMVVSSFPLLIVRGRMFGAVLLCEHLSQ